MKYLNEFSQHNQGISYSEFEKNILINKYSML